MSEIHKLLTEMVAEKDKTQAAKDLVIKSFTDFLADESLRTKKTIDATTLPEVAYLYYSTCMEAKLKKACGKYKRRVRCLEISMVLVFGSLFAALWWAQDSRLYNQNIGIVLSSIFVCMAIFYIVGIWIEQSNQSSTDKLEAISCLKEHYGNHYMSIVMKHLPNKRRL